MQVRKRFVIAGLGALLLGAAAVEVGPTTEAQLQATLSERLFEEGPLERTLLEATQARPAKAPAPRPAAATLPAELKGAFWVKVGGVEMERPAGFRHALQAWFDHDMSNGWSVLGGIGPDTGRTWREAWFTRRAGWIDWPIRVKARAIACQDSAVACFEARAPGGETRVELGGRRRLHVRPHVLLSLYRVEAGLEARVSFATLVRSGDLSAAMASADSLRWRALGGFLERLLTRPSVDIDEDGYADDWVMSGVTSASVQLGPGPRPSERRRWN